MEYEKYDKTIKVNGKSVKCEVTIKVVDDDIEFLLDQDFESKKQKEEYIRKIENQELFSGCIIVVARALGCEGVDSLGGCELKPNNMFDSRPFNESIESYLKDYGMEKTALGELKKTIGKEHARLTEEYKELYSKIKTFRKYAE